MPGLREFLKQKAEEQRHDGSSERREEWIDAVRRLDDQIIAWLKEADPEGLLLVVRSSTARSERGLGTYQVPSLQISLGESLAHVEAVGRNVVGSVSSDGVIGDRAEGRVDIWGTGGKYILHRAIREGHDVWYALDDRFRAEPLDQAKLEEILLDLLS
jgi:hypothetical protein